MITKKKLEDVSSRLDGVSSRINDVSSNLNGVSSDLKLLTRQFNDVGSMAIKDHPRIDALEERVGNLEAGVH